MSNAVTSPSTRKLPRADENLVGLYLNEIRRVRVLTRAEETALACRAARGCAEARETLVRANLRFVVIIAKKYQHRGIPLEDLINEGNIGLLHAVERFNAKKGHRFISYAVWWIRRSILNAIYTKGRTIRLPKERAMEVARLENAFEPGFVPSKRASWLRAVAREPVSLDAPLSSETASRLGDVVEDRSARPQIDHVISRELRDDISAVLGTLSFREAEIIAARFGLCEGRALSLRELGQRHQLTLERIRQIEKKALRELHAQASRLNLRDYMRSETGRD
jgi:RNA polymerase primary sigma factor